ncbi:MAG: hypothetical protein N0E54_14880 [Candidatus Thiodiazotropha taylori]|nr:hypothetical protein [Candidatus Thiodiazotropha endolucinida]MCW4230021.1 hypothetical protein [Candidatus Thiodiazotropha taylori]
MIKLRGRNICFELTIDSYEYPSALDYDDANWLTVRITAVDDGVSWKAKDNCLLTYELVELREWIKAIISNKNVDSKLSFLEGEFSVSYDVSRNVLNIHLDFVFHPKGEGYVYGEGGDKKYTLSFPFDGNAISIVEALDELIKEYPERLKDKRYT